MVFKEGQYCTAQIGHIGGPNWVAPPDSSHAHGDWAHLEGQRGTVGVEGVKAMKSLEIKARFLRGEMEHLRLREFQPGLCRYVERAEKAV